MNARVVGTILFTPGTAELIRRGAAWAAGILK